MGTEKPHKTLSLYLLVLMLLLRAVASSFPSFHNNHARRIPLKKRLATLSASASSSSKMETTTKTIESDGTQTPVIVQLPALSDNYVFLLHCANTKSTAVIDTPEVGPI